MSDLTDGAIRAKEDKLYRNVFLQENTRFILSRAYAAVGHYVTESDDEWSVALMAFNDAIDRFEPGKGEFDGFAALVIRRRLYDYLRSERRFVNEISLEPYAIDADDFHEDDEVSSIAMEVRQKTVEQAFEGADERDITDEIASVGEVLAAYGFSFMDLADASPKAAKTKDGCARVVAAVLSNDFLRDKLRSQKALPIQDILVRVKVSRKLLERHRRYIIAAVEILDGDFPLLSEYMESIRKVMVE